MPTPETTRRDFVKLSSAALAVAATQSVLVLCTEAAAAAASTAASAPAGQLSCRPLRPAPVRPKGEPLRLSPRPRVVSAEDGRSMTTPRCDTRMLDLLLSYSS